MGTPKDNSDDMRSKNRAVYPHGEIHGFSKLNWAKVKEIRYKHSLNIPQKQLAKEYGVKPVTIWQVVHNVTWKQ